MRVNRLFNLATSTLLGYRRYIIERGEWESKINPSTIAIATEYSMPDKITVRISDNGHGIPENVKQRLFDPFFTTKPAGKGTGLGLSIGYKIVVEKHKGSLRCESVPGRGTEFSIEIPLRQEVRKTAPLVSHKTSEAA